MKKVLIISLHILFVVLTAALTLGVAVLITFFCTKDDVNNELVKQITNIINGVFTGFDVSLTILLMQHCAKEIQIRKSIQSDTTDLRIKLNFHENLSDLFLSQLDVYYINLFDQMVQENIKKCCIKSDIKKLHLNLSELVKKLNSLGSKVIVYNAKEELCDCINISNHLL